MTTVNNTYLNVITVVSPMYDGADKKDQDRAVWFPVNQTACVCDGVTSSPFAAEAAEGYTPPYAWRDGNLDARQTWCQQADRYALSILIAEFLILDESYPLTAEGGMFNQEQLRKRSGRGLDKARKALSRQWPDIAPLFEATIRSEDFRSCPSPQDWKNIFDNIPIARLQPLGLEQAMTVSRDYFQSILSKNRSPAALWPAPSLSGIPKVNLSLPKTNRVRITLPTNPWS